MLVSGLVGLRLIFDLVPHVLDLRLACPFGTGLGVKDFRARHCTLVNNDQVKGQCQLVAMSVADVWHALRGLVCLWIQRPTKPPLEDRYEDCEMTRLRRQVIRIWKTSGRMAAALEKYWESAQTLYKLGYSFDQDAAKLAAVRTSTLGLPQLWSPRSIPSKNKLQRYMTDGSSTKKYSATGKREREIDYPFIHM